MKKTLSSLVVFFCLGVSFAKAQDAFVSESILNESLLLQTSTSTSPLPTDSNKKMAVGLYLGNTISRTGVGLNWSYDFTKILRFSLDGNYYLYGRPGIRFNTITPTGEKGESFWGRNYDVNANLNFVFGDGNFHFYLLTGLYFAHAYRESTNSVSGLLNFDNYHEYNEDGYYNNGSYYVEGGKLYYNTDHLDGSIGFGFNAGCGIEYVISDAVRISLDHQLSLGILTMWSLRLGVSYYIM